MQLTEKVKKFINEHQLLSDNEKLIIGVSGGADSMALLKILRTLDYDCVAAHCNFHLRGEESDRDENFVEGYCKYNNIQYVTTSFDTKQYMKEKSVSLEMAARELRYNWFEKIRNQFSVNKIAIAHHQDDSIETILINLIRGCGIRGLTGIKPINGSVIRPMLCLYREEVMTYLEEERIPYVNDSSNTEDIFVRNKIRLNILPQFESINPSVKQAISKTSQYLSDIEVIYLSYIETLKQEIFDGKYIDLSKLQTLEKPCNILFEILHPLGFNSTVIENIFNSIDNISGKTFYSDKYRLIKDRGKFIIEEITYTSNESYTINSEEKLINIPVKLSIDILEKGDDFELEKNKKVLFADLSKVDFPLTIRRWQQGDRFIPLGMTGSKKLSDYFTDRKLSLSEKENVWLLCSAKNRIIWIIGERSDNRVKITDKTTNILKIEIID